MSHKIKIEDEEDGMKSFKYVIVSKLYPIVFSEAMSHKEFKDKNVTSAGFGQIFCKDGEIKVSVHGKSVALKVEADSLDVVHLEMLFKTDLAY